MSRPIGHTDLYLAYLDELRCNLSLARDATEKAAAWSGFNQLVLWLEPTQRHDDQVAQWGWGGGLQRLQETTA